MEPKRSEEQNTNCEHCPRNRKALMVSKFVRPKSCLTLNVKKFAYIEPAAIRSTSESCYSGYVLLQKVTNCFKNNV
jgi:hypothetical protein